ncbi:hypothetical protein F4821DRAFT_234482 [Hypoxylon rubiginosum]|uniref:Uncharacterized protein n=1 Tax=Hypoxylon rubiginosum TaxID=110542 RepID=A0ACC0D5Y3_9PEZI|nr:hypothetical protein F4821DRAFT_234482 [Hypoxylon rubiginosum]
MLRRPPTTLTLTAEDVAAYEDRRFASQAQQSQTQGHSPAGHPHQTAMDTSSSSSSSSSPMPPPPHTHTQAGGDDEDMRDVAEEEEENDEEEIDDTDDPFGTGVNAPRRSAREQLHNRPVSPGQARAAYLQQMRATRSHQQPHQQQPQPTAPAAAPTRMQRITGAPTQQARTTGLGTARSAAASRQGSTEPSAAAQGRMMTRSREERIGVAPHAAAAPSRRR